MGSDKPKPEGTTKANDEIAENAHYSENGVPRHIDERDRKDSTDDWDADGNLISRYKVSNNLRASIKNRFLFTLTGTDEV